MFKGMYEAELEFPEGGEVQTEKPFLEWGMDIFWNNTMTSSQSTCIRDCFGFSIVRSFIVVMILDRANQHKRGMFRRDAR